MSDGNSEDAGIFRALLNATYDNIYIIDRENRYTHVSRGGGASVGLTPEQMIGRTWRELGLPADVLGEAEREWQRILATGETVRHEVDYLGSSYEYVMFPVDDRVAVMSRNVTERLKVERENQRAVAVLSAQSLRNEFVAAANDLFAQSLEYEQTLRNLAQMAVPRLADWCAVDMLESDGTLRRLAVAHIDPEMIRLAYQLETDYPSDPNAQQGAPHVARTGKTEWVAAIPEELMPAAARSPEHLTLIRKLRLRSWICTALPVRDGVAGVLTLINTDSSRIFTESDVALAEELALRAGHAIDNARLYKQSVEANRAKDEFLATLSHELRTPLTAILGWANLLRTSEYDENTVRTGVATIEQSAKSQAALIDELLDVSRIITGKLQLDVRPVDIVPVIENGLASARTAAAARRISIHVETPAALVMNVDSNRLQQIVWNLMSNAVKFSAEGSRIDLSLRRNGDDAVLSIKDQGIGIPATLLPHVFDRFWQADSTNHRQHGGLGLGLSIVKYLAELHGGQASVSSGGQGQGTTFSVTLPVSGAASS